MFTKNNAVYEPFVLNVVWKIVWRCGNLCLEKYGFLKWKMCRNFALWSTLLSYIKYTADL